MKTKYTLLDKRAEAPKQATEGSAGYDIKIIDVYKIVDDVIFFKTGLSIEAPKGHYFELAPRSSISKLPLMLANSIGQIDEDYRGEIIVPIRVMHQEQGNGKQIDEKPAGFVTIFENRPTSISTLAKLIVSKQPYLAQLIIRQRLETEWELSESLSATERKDGGFGSTDTQKAKISFRRVE